MKTLVWMNFDRDDRPKGGFRFKKTLGSAAWWRRRAATLDQYTLPSLEQQTNRDFLVVASLLPDVDMRKSLPVRKVLKAAGAEVNRRGYQRLVELAAGHGLLQILLDSDDMYREDAVARYKHACAFAPGASCLYAGNGFAYDTADGRLFRYVAPGGPAPFFAIHYPADALRDLDAFWKYTHAAKLRRKADHEWVHHRMHKAAGALRLGNGMYCGTVNGANTSKEWGNVHFKRHVKGELVGERRAAVLARFGVPA